VSDSVLVDYVNIRPIICGEQGIDVAGVLVEQKQLFVVNTRCAQKVESVRLGFSQGLFVAVYHLIGVVLDAAERDKSTAFKVLARGSLKCLGVDINRRGGVLQQDALFPPHTPERGRAGVYVFCGIVVGFAVAQNNPDEVKRAGRVISLLHGRSDLVIGLSNHLRGGYLLLVVAKRTERAYVGHRKPLIVTS